MSLTLASVYVKEGDSGGTGTDSSDHVGNSALANAVNSIEDVRYITEVLRSESSSISPELTYYR